MGVHPHSVQRWEAGKAKPSLGNIKALLVLYGLTQAEIDTFADEVKQAKRPEWWASYPAEVLPRTLHRFISLEGAASVIRTYEPNIVTALLRTRDYARALLRAQRPDIGPGLLDRHLDLLAERQRQHLGSGATEPSDGRYNRPALWVVLDETSVRRDVGGPDVMRGQIEYLISMAGRPEVQLQIVPHRYGVYPGMEGGAFHLFRFAAPELPDIVHRDNLEGGEYLEGKTGSYLKCFDTMCAGYAAPTRDTPEILRGIAEAMWEQ